MHKIELKRITRTPGFIYSQIGGGYYHTDDLIIEFKLLSKLRESDKEELNIFLTQELINKDFIRKEIFNKMKCLEFHINLEEINKNINKITDITRTINTIDCNYSYHYCYNCYNCCNYESNYIKNDKSKSLIDQKESEINKLQNEILIAKKEEEINKLIKEIEILKKDIDK